MKRFLRLFVILSLGVAVANCVKPEPDDPNNGTEQPGPDKPAGPASGNDTGAGNYGGSGEGSEPGATPEEGLTYSYEYAATTVAMKDDMASQITNASQSAFTMPWDPSEHVLKNGDIVLIPACDAYPGGYVAKISGSSVSPDGKTCKYDVSLAELNEAFKQLHFSQTGMDISSYAKEIIAPDGSKIPFTKASSGLTLKIPEMLGLTSIGVDIGKNVTITPSMEVSFKLDLGCDIVDCAVTYARMRVDAGAKLAADVAIKATAELPWTSPTYHMVFAAIPVGPVVITPEVYMSFYVKLTGEVNLTFSVSYQKSYAAVTMYDGEFHSQAAETTPSSSDNPFKVSGNLSGSVEFGPNIGVALSVYGGALGLGVDFDPHLVLTTSLSAPLDSNMLNNMGDLGWYLSNAYFEPAVKFGFGATMILGYGYSYHVEVPENVSLVKSFGKHYFLPSMAKAAKTSFANNVLKFESHIIHKPLFDGQIYLKIVNGDADPDKDYIAVPLTVDPFPSDCEESDSVICRATYPVDKLPEGALFRVMGPFIKTSLLGIDADFKMYPGVSYREGYFAVSPAVERAMRGILSDIRKSASSEWKDCNWGDPDHGMNTWTNVGFTLPDYAEDGSVSYSTEIRLDEGWKTGNAISVSDHSAQLSKGKLKWSLSAYDADRRNLNSFTVDDQGFSSFFGFDVSSKIVIHAREFESFFPDMSKDAACDVDLSESGLRYLRNYYMTSDDKGNDVLYCMSGNFNLDKCPQLSSVELRGSRIPSGLSFMDCPRMKECVLQIGYLTSDSKFPQIDDISPLSNYTGSCIGGILIQCDTKTGSIDIDGARLPISEDGIVSIRSVGLSSLTVSDQPNLARVDNGWSYGMGEFDMSKCLAGLTIRNCASLKGVDAHNLEELHIADCPVLTDLTARDSFSNDLWDGRLKILDVSACPKLTTVSICSSHVGGVLPSWLETVQKNSNAINPYYPYKYQYNYKSYLIDSFYHIYRAEPYVEKTYPNGYYYPGEPGSAYTHPRKILMEPYEFVYP